MSTQLREQQVQLRDAEVYTANKNVTAMYLLLVTQIFYCFMYGFFIRINPSGVSNSEHFVHMAFLFVLIIIGFGLALGSSYRMVWSKIGFNLLITALSVQTFFLVNAFWNKAAIFIKTYQFGVSTYTITLTANQIANDLSAATLNQAIKCALACIVAFSFIIGRAGILQAYVVSVAGSIVYELIRQICMNNFPYEVGTIKIFLYGGILGLVTSVVFEKLTVNSTIVNHEHNTLNKTSVSLTLLGVVICWALFPLLGRDAHDLLSAIQVTFTRFPRVYAIYLAMSAAGLLGAFLGYFNFGFDMFRYSIIGAGAAILSSSAYISNPVYAVVFGLFSAICQYFFLLLNRRIKHSYGPIDPHAFALVGQGFLGLFYATINRRIVETNDNQISFAFNATYSKAPQYILGNSAITIAIAAILGFVLGTVFYCCSYHERADHYNDFTYWTREGPAAEVAKHQEVHEVTVTQKNVAIKEKNAYL